MEGKLELVFVLYVHARFKIRSQNATLPVENGFIESFNGRLRDECLNVHVFFTLDDVREKLAQWREDYTYLRPHSSLQDKPPVVFAADWSTMAARVPTSPELLESVT